MKRFFVGMGLIVLFLSCDKIDELTKFNIDYDSSVVIESSANISLPFDVLTPEMETNSESEFEVNDTRKDLIEEIILTELSLDITAPDNQDFSFLESIEVFISAEDLEEQRITYVEDVPDTVGTTLDLGTSDLDLKEYIKKDKFQLRLNTVTDKALTQDVHIDVHSVFFVDAKILGL